MSSDIGNFKKRLIYRSQYRGTKEMDKLIGSFVQDNIDKFNGIQLTELEKFLNIDDDILYKFYNNQITDIDLVNSEITKLFKKFKYRK